MYLSRQTLHMLNVLWPYSSISTIYTSFRFSKQVLLNLLFMWPFENESHKHSPFYRAINNNLVDTYQLKSLDGQFGETNITPCRSLWHRRSLKLPYLPLSNLAPPKCTLYGKLHVHTYLVKKPASGHHHSRWLLGIHTSHSSNLKAH